MSFTAHSWLQIGFFDALPYTAHSGGENPAFSLFLLYTEFMEEAEHSRVLLYRIPKSKTTQPTPKHPRVTLACC